MPLKMIYFQNLQELEIQPHNVVLLLQECIRRRKEILAKS